MWCTGGVPGADLDGLRVVAVVTAVGRTGFQGADGVGKLKNWKSEKLTAHLHVAPCQDSGFSGFQVFTRPRHPRNPVD